jgi:predicted GNAT family acetyltransferase
MNERAATWLASHLDREVEECQGPASVAKRFADVFGLVKSKGYEVEMFQGVYRLDDVDGHYPFESEGLVEASTLDHDLLQSLVEGFMEDCYAALAPETRRKQSEEMLARHLKQKALFAWRNADSEIVAIAARSRESLSGATISLVYTPPKHRRKGYAGRLVAALSRRVLEGGKTFCMLYTDLKNPTSNSVYRRLGYRQIGESLHCRFWERRD